MATFYPLISGNPSANSKLNLYTGVTDNLFDAYVFTKPDNTQELFMLFIIKNTHVSTDSSLAITSVSGNDAFNTDFTIDPLGKRT